MTFDVPDKDSWRHIQAGSEVMLISSPGRVVLIKPVVQPLTLDEGAHLVGEDCDIILAEGFKQDNALKIEIYRKELGTLLSTVKKFIAVVTDEPLDTKTRQFSLQDIKGLADLLEKGFLKSQREQISLYVSNVSVPLTTFPREIISNVLLSMVSCLKGVGEVSSLDISLRRSSS
jgi:molybdopterin-guanine dinucleotide biosynthesis protein B